MGTHYALCRAGGDIGEVEFRMRAWRWRSGVSELAAALMTLPQAQRTEQPAFSSFFRSRTNLPVSYPFLPL